MMPARDQVAFEVSRCSVVMGSVQMEEAFKRWDRQAWVDGP
jgi:hypothetical protein